MGLRAGNKRERHFCGQGGEQHRTRGTASTSGPLAEEERREDVTKMPGGGGGGGGSMINTRALFSDFLPRDPRAQIACK